MKTLLLTGGAGFIGHHTVEHVLKNTNWNIIVLDSLNYAGNLNYIADIELLKKKEYKDRLRIIYHDLRAPISKTTRALLPERINYLIHMAAESHVDNSIKNPAPFVYSNVVGTMNILDFAKEVYVDRFILVSTDEVYGPSINGHLHKEGEPHRPGNPYSASKSGAEALAYAYWNTYALPVIITNTMNNFGERQHPEKFVPKTIHSILTDNPVVVHCKKKGEEVIDISSRCWLHARNHADALVYLLKKGFVGERYNITGEKYDVRDMVYFIGNILGVPDPKVSMEDFHSFRRGHDMHYGLDGTKLAGLGWEPPMDFSSSLEKTVLWFKDNKKWLGL